MAKIMGRHCEKTLQMNTGLELRVKGYLCCKLTRSNRLQNHLSTGPP